MARRAVSTTARVVIAAASLGIAGVLGALMAAGDGTAHANAPSAISPGSGRFDDGSGGFGGRFDGGPDDGSGGTRQAPHTRSSGS